MRVRWGSADLLPSSGGIPTASVTMYVVLYTIVPCALMPMTNVFTIVIAFLVPSVSFVPTSRCSFTMLRVLCVTQLQVQAC
jgi:hypothetical protein